MNFKPTLLKTIISIIAAIISLIYAEGGITCDKPTCPLVHQSSIMFAIISLILVYIIWSLVQKK